MNNIINALYEIVFSTDFTRLLDLVYGLNECANVANLNLDLAGQIFEQYSSMFYILRYIIALVPFYNALVDVVLHFNLPTDQVNVIVQGFQSIHVDLNILMNAQNYSITIYNNAMNYDNFHHSYTTFFSGAIDYINLHNSLNTVPHFDILVEVYRLNELVLSRLRSIENIINTVILTLLCNNINR